MRCFGNRHIELLVEPILEALQDAPLVLERLASLDVQLPGRETDDHVSGL